MPIVLGNTTITGLGVGGLPDGTINADDLASGAVTRAKMGYAGAIVKMSNYTWNTRTTIPKQAANTIWTNSVVKEFSSTVSTLIAWLHIPAHGTYSDWCGIYAHISGSTSTSNDGSAFQGITYMSGDAANEPVIIHMNGKRFDSLNAGTHSLVIGYTTRNGSSGDAPANNSYNPNSSDDARQHQTGSTLTVYEVLI
jgi:hypothetical protein